MTAKDPKTGYMVLTVAGILLLVGLLVAIPLITNGFNSYVSAVGKHESLFYQERCNTEYETHAKAYQAWFNDRNNKRGPVLKDFGSLMEADPASAPHWKEGVLVSLAIMHNRNEEPAKGSSQTLSDCGWTSDDVRSFALYLKAH